MVFLATSGLIKYFLGTITPTFNNVSSNISKFVKILRKPIFFHLLRDFGNISKLNLTLHLCSVETFLIMQDKNTGDCSLPLPHNTQAAASEPYCECKHIFGIFTVSGVLYIWFVIPHATISFTTKTESLIHCLPNVGNSTQHALAGTTQCNSMYFVHAC